MQTAIVQAVIIYAIAGVVSLFVAIMIKVLFQLVRAFSKGDGS
jgi:hypothetical protein